LLEDYTVVNFTYGGVPGTFSLDTDKYLESDARGTFTVLSEDGTELVEYPVRLEDGDYQIIRDTPVGEMEPQSISFEEYAEEWNGR